MENNNTKWYLLGFLGCVWGSFLEIQIFMKSYLNIGNNLLKSEQNHQKSMFWIRGTLKVPKIAHKIMKM